MSEYVRALSLAELEPGQCMEVSVGGKPVALYNVAGAIYATSNTCIHRGGPLGQGSLDGPVVLCPWHSWSWDVTTGENTANPELKIPTYPVRIEDGQVLVRVG